MEENKKEKYKSTFNIFVFIKDIISWTFFALLLLVALVLVYYVFANFNYSKKGKGHEPLFFLYTIISPSMTPNINVYDVIVDVPVKDASTIKVGDVITFISDSSISKDMRVTHRVTAISTVNGKYEFTTKGDNNVAEDSSRAKEDNVVGIVKFKIPQLGRIQYFLASKSGWLFVILIPAIIILIADVTKIVRMLGVNKSVKEIEETENTDEELKKKLDDKKEKLTKRYKKDKNVSEEQQEEAKTDIEEEKNDK